ncbi:MAG: SRPBCC family protein [Candidatus Rokubacteria bacterium]|nr:SRPBCC family protein [Candidatus Rokubacteria bacterium]
MADYVLESRFWLPCPRPVVFDFFADPRHLALVQPPSAHFAWSAPPPRRLEAGTVLDFTLRVLGLRLRWRVMVREFDAPYRFVDAQLWGPFARWEHRHRFVEQPERGEPGAIMGTLVEDRVTYRLPAGPLGLLAHALFARRRIARLFAHREARLRELLAATQAPDG